MLAEEINNHTVLEELRLHPHLRELLAPLHTNSWFCFQESDACLDVRKGGRQGCRFGSKFFNLAYAEPLKDFSSKMQELGVALRIWQPNDNEARSYPNSTATVASGRSQEGVPVIDVEFVDDGAFVLTAAVPATSKEHHITAARILESVLSRYNMVVTWAAPRKMENIELFRGKLAKHHKSSLMRDDGSKAIPLTLEDGHHVELRVVSQYKHLGSVVDDTGSLVPDARSRASPAMKSYVPLASKIIWCRNLGVQIRVRLEYGLIVSKLMCNVHVWS